MTVITGSAGGSAAWAELEADTYNATIDGYEDAGPSKFDPDKEQLKFRYALEERDEAGDAITLHQWVNKVLSPKSNLAAIVAAAGLTWEPGKPFDLDSLVGRPVRLMVNVKETDNGPRPAIAEVIPPKAKAAAAPRAKAPSAASPVAQAGEECSLPKCHEELAVFDADGNGFCEKHRKMAE